MRDLDRVLIAIYELLKSYGYWDEAIDVAVSGRDWQRRTHRSRRERHVWELAEYRLRLLSIGLPLEEIAFYDR